MCFFNHIVAFTRHENHALVKFIFKNNRKCWKWLIRFIFYFSLFFLSSFFASSSLRKWFPIHFFLSSAKVVSMQQKTRYSFFRFHTVSREVLQFDLKRWFKPTFHLCIDLAESYLGSEVLIPMSYSCFVCTFLGLLAWLDPRNTVSPCRYKYINIKRNINGKRKSKRTFHPISNRASEELDMSVLSSDSSPMASNRF